MKRFLKYVLLFISPFLLIVGLYVAFDPFKVIRHYDNYYSHPGPGINRNLVSTMNYLDKREQYHYDSFIFGNSRSLFYLIDDWKQHIAGESSCYHFSESAGSILGILSKLRLIDSLNDSIRNVIFVVDCDLLNRGELNEPKLMLPPALTGNSNLVRFHTEHLKLWVNPGFLFYWTKFMVSGKFEPGTKMEKYIMEGSNFKYYDPVTNEEPNHIQDSQIAAGAYFDDARIKVFKNQQHPKTSEPVLDEERKSSLKEINDILTKHHTKFRIVISPLYNQTRINPADLEFLKSLFGPENVFDFSGVNKYTNDYHNYYEASHYRSSVAAEIMDSIYLAR